MAQMDVTELLDKIAESKRKYAFPIFIPSLNKEVPFYQMTTEQQKNLLKASMTDTGRFSNTMYALFSIIKDNCADKSIDVTKFTLIDKLIVTIAIRMFSISPTYKVVVNDITDKDTGKPLNASINLESLIKKILKQFRGKKFTETIQSESSDIKAIISLPTIGTEIAVEQDMEADARKNANADGDVDLSSSGIGDLYILECMKFLSAIVVTTDVDGKPTETTVDVSTMSSSDKKRTFESLPAAISIKIAERVNEIVSEINDITLLKLKHEGEEHVYKIDLNDPDFFIGS